METDPMKIYEEFRKDQIAEDEQELRLSCESINRETKYVVWRGDTPIEQYDTLTEAVCRQITEKYG